MVPKEFMFIAADNESDQLAAALVSCLREQVTNAEAGYTDETQPLHASLEPKFYGVGGELMRQAGVELLVPSVHLAASCDSGENSLRHRFMSRRVFSKLYRLAVEREPNAIFCFGYFAFNARLAHAVKRYGHRRENTFCNWEPLMIQISASSEPGSASGSQQERSREFDLVLAPESSESISQGGQPRPAELQAFAAHAAAAIVRRFVEDEPRFPLRAYLHEDVREAA